MEENFQTPATEEPIHNPLSVMQPGERTICEIKRHPIGLLSIYAVVGFMLLLLALVIFAIAPSLFSDTDRNQVMSIGAVVLLLAAVLGVTFAFISNIVYWGNRWIVTSDSITQVQQSSLFNKQHSQLSLANLEDVTVEKNGILPHLFNYGVIKAETAGERSKFTFPYCPNPDLYAQQILNARERFEQSHHGGKQQPIEQTQ
jgi:uncharacterized membrane protein YdbT with pleckstrin-like domain